MSGHDFQNKSFKVNLGDPSITNNWTKCCESCRNEDDPVVCEQCRHWSRFRRKR